MALTAEQYVSAALDTLYASIDKLPTLEERAVATSVAAAAWHEAATQLAGQRQKLTRQLRSKGWTDQRIADLFGTSRQRVTQIIDKPSPKRQHRKEVAA